jgi:hypothetical protein
MSFFLAGKQSALTETRSICITARPTLALLLRQAAFAAFSPGWIRMEATQRDVHFSERRKSFGKIGK